MDITFKYNGKIITTPNLEKKLKRMKLQLSDIEIIDTPIKKEKSESGIEDYMLDKERIIVRSTEDNIRRICFVPKGTRPSLEELFKDVIWNPDNRTGLFTKEFIKTFYYDELLCKNEGS